MTPGKTTREAVLAALAGGPLDTIELAKTTRLDSRVVGSMCNNLLKEGLLQVKRPPITGPGKRANTWRIKPNGA
jgi:hypothetical protein